MTRTKRMAYAVTVFFCLATAYVFVVLIANSPSPAVTPGWGTLAAVIGCWAFAAAVIRAGQLAVDQAERWAKAWRYRHWICPVYNHWADHWPPRRRSARRLARG